MNKIKHFRDRSQGQEKKMENGDKNQRRPGDDKGKSGVNSQMREGRKREGEH